ncbi:MAG: adenosylcobalamin-dependent ribonucleoside-diphosphate reductase [Candidatus Beckwithbacteria bacterium]|nr:adenosylcobalamin-dependent ribonucleoside-diphosphate reductase [Candidatus Beckwithbacteria bacterium]
MENDWQVKKRSGEIQVYVASKISHSIFRAQQNINKEDQIKASKIGQLVREELKQKFEKEKILGTDEIGDVVERVLIDQKLYDVARAFIIAREKQRQEAKAEKGLGVIDDIGLPYNSILVMKNKYLLKNETPKGCFKRVAKALAKAEKTEKKRAFWEDKFLEIMSSLRFLPGGRTLANAGTTNNQLANCFVMPMPDSVEGIFESIKESSILKKNGGGVGFSFSHIRPKGDKVAGTSGKAAGPVAFMRIINEASEILQQAGGRRSGNMVILHITHPDILEFITCKEDEGQLNNINFSLGITDKFMVAVKKDRPWNLINPHTGTVANKVSARSIFELAASYAWKNGDPGMIFLDRINRDNPTPQAGVLEAVNLCGEQPLLAYEACNLGSVNLARHVKVDPTSPTSRRIRGVDWSKLKETVEVGVRLLDNVVSICKYPLKKVEQVVRANRKIGLGVMGWADMLAKLNIPYNSQEALRLAGKLMKFIQETTWQVSESLGKEKGSFPNFETSIWPKRSFKSFRNATLITIAPTGSISMLANCSYGIEPHFANAFYKEALGGVRLPEINKDLLAKLRTEGLDMSNGLIDQISNNGTLQLIKEIPEKIKKIFLTAHELEFEDHIKMQAAWQKYTDNAVSKTINMRSDARIEDVVKAYILAWELGCKGITVYRDQSRKEQVLNVGYSKRLKINDERLTRNQKSEKCPQCGTKMLKTEGCATCPNCAFSVCSL